MTNETIQTESAKANDESRARQDQRTSGGLSLKRIKVAHSAQHVSSRTGYGILVSD